MKLGNFFVGNTFKISQSPHGSLQGNKAIDAVPVSGNRVIAPCDMEIYYRKNDLGTQSYSYARGNGFRIIFVHAMLEKTGHVKKGTDIGYLCASTSTHAMHLHTAIEVNGVWDVVLNYMDRSITLALTAGFSSQHWKDWSSWKNLELGGTVSTGTHCIPLSDYEYGKEANLGFFRTYADANAHATMDGFIWYVKHGVTRFNQLLQEKIDRIKQLELVEQTLNNEVSKLNASIGGLTTDRNKYKAMVDESQPKIESLTAENGTLKIELEGIRKELKDMTLAKDIVENQLSNVQPKIDEAEEKARKFEIQNNAQKEEITKLLKALQNCKENKGMTLVEFLQKLFQRK